MKDEKPKKQGKQKFLYNDSNERNKRMNRFYLPTSYVLFFLLIVYLWMKLAAQSTQEISTKFCLVNTGLIVVFSVLNLIVYKKYPAGHNLCRLMLCEILAMVAIIGIKTGANFVFIILAGVLAMFIPYYTPNVFFKFAIAYTVVSVGISMYRMAAFTELATVDDFMKTVCVASVYLVLNKVSRIVNEFNDDAIGAVGEQTAKQKEMLDKVISISQEVADKTEQSTGVIDELVNIAGMVDSSMKEITDAAALTAQSVEEQNLMTQSIRDAITDTGERSKQLVAVVRESNEGIQTNIALMDSLKEQSVLIANTNHSVSEAMTRLSDKTKAMEAIVDMILSISEQTNLLSLNASIESARAGEAGRGFAVVADQIRQLAEQTKVSTEEIARIIQELNQNASEVTNSVNDSVAATDEQGRKILAAADTFEKLNENMTHLISGINEIDTSISELTEANNKIVENITQVSATTEEVVASADQVMEFSAKNMEHAAEVKDAIAVIRKNSEGLKAYK